MFCPSPIFSPSIPKVLPQIYDSFQIIIFITGQMPDTDSLQIPFCESQQCKCFKLNSIRKKMAETVLQMLFF